MCEMQEKLLEAVRNGDMEGINSALQCGAEINVPMGENPLHVALLSCREDIMYFLVNHGAALNMVDESELTPLMTAVVIDNEHMVTSLLNWFKEAEEDDEGCDTVSLPPYIYSPQLDIQYSLCFAIAKRNAAIIERLLEAEPRLADCTSLLSPLHIAAALNDGRTLRMMLGNTCDVNLLDGAGYTPLHYAAGCSSFGSTEILMRSGGNKDVPGTDGKTPRQIAEECANMEFLMQFN